MFISSVALSACLAGEVAKFLVRGMYEDAKEAALKYEKIFGKGNYFLPEAPDDNNGDHPQEKEKEMQKKQNGCLRRPYK